MIFWFRRRKAPSPDLGGESRRYSVSAEVTSETANNNDRLRRIDDILVDRLVVILCKPSHASKVMFELNEAPV